MGLFILGAAGLIQEGGVVGRVLTGAFAGGVVPALILLGIGRALRRRGKRAQTEEPQVPAQRPPQRPIERPQPERPVTRPKPSPRPQPEPSPSLEEVLAELDDQGRESGGVERDFSDVPVELPEPGSFGKSSQEMIDEARRRFSREDG